MWRKNFVSISTIIQADETGKDAMKRVLTATLVAMSVCLSASACGGKQEAEFGIPDQQAIRSVTSALETSFNAKDVDKLLTLYTENSVFMPPNKPLLRGRDLTEDDARRPRAIGRPIVVNETFARRFFDVRDPIGRRVVLEDAGGEGMNQSLEVVGVARDSKLRSLNEESHPVLYLPELTTTFMSWQPDTCWITGISRVATSYRCSPTSRGTSSIRS